MSSLIQIKVNKIPKCININSIKEMTPIDDNTEIIFMDGSKVIAENNYETLYDIINSLNKQPRVTLSFDLKDPDDKIDYEITKQAENMYFALSSIGNELFRPARKHGYNHNILQKLVEPPEGSPGWLTSKDYCELTGEKIEMDCDHYNSYAAEAIGILEEMFYDILHNHSINLDY